MYGNRNTPCCTEYDGFETFVLSVDGCIFCDDIPPLDFGKAEEDTLCSCFGASQWVKSQHCTSQLNQSPLQLLGSDR